jgi:threonine/homoserine/homoserine lactone efflux protein
MLSLVVSTIAFFVAGYFINRFLNSIDSPKGMTRSILKFCAALLIAYGVAFLIDRIVP